MFFGLSFFVVVASSLLVSGESDSDNLSYLAPVLRKNLQEIADAEARIRFCWKSPDCSNISILEICVCLHELVNARTHARAFVS